MVDLAFLCPLILVESPFWVSAPITHGVSTGVSRGIRTPRAFGFGRFEWSGDRLRMGIEFYSGPDPVEALSFRGVAGCDWAVGPAARASAETFRRRGVARISRRMAYSLKLTIRSAPSSPSGTRLTRPSPVIKWVETAPEHQMKNPAKARKRGRHG